VATATKSQGKTRFVNQFLQNNPQANTKAVNEAWTAAGMKGAISHPVISRVRKERGLIGNRPGKTRKAAKGKASARMSQTVSSPGKSMFVKEFLNDHPQGNVVAVNEAWQAAGFDGTISKTLVDKTRALLGLTGKLSGNSKKTRRSAKGTKRGRPVKETAAAVNVQPRGSKSARTLALTDLETDIDRLIFKMMAIGDLTEIEDTMRQARRMLYQALYRG